MLERRAGASLLGSEEAGRVRIAVLEDDEALRTDILVPGLAAHGFEVEGFARSGELYRRLLATSFDVALLDISLPDEDGLSVASHLRGISPMGIVILTGRSDPLERVRGLDEAVDVWLHKPVEVEVVVASIRSLLRRMRMGTPSVPDGETSAPFVWRLVDGGWRLLAPSGAGVDLTRSERGLLACLFAAAGEVVARERLIAGLDADADEFDPHRLEMLIHRLRRKVADASGESLPLRSVRGLGYVLFAQVEASPQR